MKRKNKLILEFTEFNLQRYNDTSVQSSVHVDDPQLSINAFDKHQDAIRSAMVRINDIMHKLSDTNAYKTLRGKVAMEHQDLKNLRILRIVKVDIRYNVYLEFIIGEDVYWGVVEDILGQNPTFKSEVFRDYDLYQAKEWIIKTKGLIIKTIKLWLKPEPGIYKLLEEEIICYSIETGKQLRMTKGIEIELIRAHSDRMIISYKGDDYNLVGDNYIYFNWWFEKIED